MVVMGIMFFLFGWLLGLSILETLGVILVVVGLILNVVPIRGERRRYW